MKRILITGANSYIGTSFENYIKENFSEGYLVDTLDMKDPYWKDKSFSGYDAIFHVAGIAHSDDGKKSTKKETIYRKINTDLAIETAKKAKADKVKQFVFMSSIIVYGKSASIGKQKIITSETPVNPENYYSDSKYQAELGLKKLEDNEFKVCILRPPMVYGKNSKGNYIALSKMAQRWIFFPYVKNKRSMIYIGNFVEFVRLMIENEERGIFFPQNKEYGNVSEMARFIANVHGRKLKIIRGVSWMLKILGFFVPRVNKAFGNLVYDQSISSYKVEYRRFSLEQSIKLTEK